MTRSVPKILFCATVDVHFRAFHLPTMAWFREQGWEVHVAANGNLRLPHCDRQHAILFARSPWGRSNLRAYRELKRLIDTEKFDLIHCHTPVGGALARLAARDARKRGTKVFYTAHGFHFCKGAPMASWLLFYPVERLLSRWTDCLVTITREDHARAVADGFPAGQSAHVHGVGVDVQRFAPLGEPERGARRAALGYGPADRLLFYAAEFNRNKNQQLLIQALAQLRQRHSGARLLLAGTGPLLESCRQLARQLGVEQAVEFLGYRDDLNQLLPLCDIAVASSLREGLPVNVMEAMACELPVVAVANRGHSELVSENACGAIVAAGDAAGLAREVTRMLEDAQVSKNCGENGRRAVLEKYSSVRVGEKLREIYRPFMEAGAADGRPLVEKNT